jgi:hypothetical protein
MIIMDDIQKKIREELAKVHNSKFAKKTDKQLAVVDNREANGWKEKNKERLSNPEYTKKVGKKISETYNTPEGKKKQASKSKPHSEETKELIRQIQLVRPPRTKETRQKIAKKQLCNQKHAQPIMTPSGAFSSIKFAAEFATEQGLSNPKPRLRKWLNDPNNLEFYSITKEQFEELGEQKLKKNLPWLKTVDNRKKK